MIDLDDMVEYVQEHIQAIVKITDIDEYTVEQVINSQIAITMGNLALEGISTNYLGQYSYNKGSKEIIFEPNNLVKDLAKGRLDAKFVLKEILENV